MNHAAKAASQHTAQPRLATPTDLGSNATKDIAGGLSALGEPLPPSAAHPLGTDFLGRSVWSRVLYGGRISLLIGFGTAFVSTLLGAAIGGLGGYAGGKTDRLLFFFSNLILSFPGILMVIAMGAAMQGATGSSITPLGLVAILSAIGWVLSTKG